MNKIDLLKSLVEKTTDKTELDKLNAEILAEVAKEAGEKVRAEMKAEADEAERQRMLKDDKPKASGIEVGLPDIYKGRRFKRELSGVQKLTKKWGDEKIAAAVVKTWLDGLDNANRNPMSKAVIGQSTTGNVGGYFVAPEYPDAYFEYAYENSRALQICDNIPMNSNIMYVPTDSARASVAITAEGTDATVTSAYFAQTTLTATRIDAFTGITNELLQDQSIAVLPILIKQLTEAVGQKVDSCVFNGTGSPMSSVFSAAAGYSVVLGLGSSTFASVTAHSPFLEVISKLPSARQRNARWAAHRTPLWAYIYNVKDAASRPLFINSTETAGVDGPVGKILGFPVTQLESGNATTAVSTAPIVFGDFSGVKIGHRLDSIDLMLDPYSIAKSNQTQVYLFTRWAFALALPNNFVRLVTSAS